MYVFLYINDPLTILSSMEQQDIHWIKTVKISLKYRAELVTDLWLLRQFSIILTLPTSTLTLILQSGKWVSPIKLKGSESVMTTPP